MQEKPKKVTVYMVHDDQVRMRVLQKALQAEYPFQRVSMSWLFRYAVYYVLKERGLASPVDARDAGVRDYGNQAGR